MKQETIDLIVKEMKEEGFDDAFIEQQKRKLLSATVCHFCNAAVFQEEQEEDESPITVLISSGASGEKTRVVAHSQCVMSNVSSVMSMRKQDAACCGCKYWSQDAPNSPFSQSGECRKASPTIVERIGLDDDLGICRGVWPTTTMFEWCGEFVAREVCGKK